MKTLLFLLLTISLFGSCDQFYYKKPTVTTIHREICNEYFVIEYSPTTKTPIYTANVLTRSIVRNSQEIGRKDTFHEEERLAPSERSTLNDYKRSGYDRGHMVPSDDMPTYESQYETFSLANIVPQNASNNRGIWKKLENKAREYTKVEEKVYVISGPIYDNLSTKINGVAVPTRLFKIIMLPQQNKTLVLVTNNSKDKTIDVISLEELEKFVPIRFDKFRK